MLKYNLNVLFISSSLRYDICTYKNKPCGTLGKCCLLYIRKNALTVLISEISLMFYLSEQLYKYVYSLE